jgi:hypothetical protein
MKASRYQAAIFILVSVLAAGLFAAPLPAVADVDVHINIPLPGLVIPAPPALLVIPGTYIYYPPDVDANIFFFHGVWYRSHGKQWFQAGDYNGPWKIVPPGKVPKPVRGLPGNYRGMSHGERLPYGQVKKNWSSWERERHWDKKAKPEKAKVKQEKKHEKAKQEHGKKKHDDDDSDGPRGHGRGR